MTTETVPPDSHDKVIKYTAAAPPLVGPTTYPVDGNVVGEADNDASGITPATIVGTNPIWSDGSDSTYAEFTAQPGVISIQKYAGCDVPCPAIDPTGVTRVDLRLRVEGKTLNDSNLVITPNPISGPFSAHAQWQYDFTDLIPPGERSMSSSTIYNTPTWITIPVAFITGSESAFFESLSDGTMQISTFWESGSTIGTPTGRIYEMQLLVYRAGSAVNSITLHGPSTTNQGNSERHRGKFAVDPATQKISGKFVLGSTDTSFWVVPVVEFFALDLTSDLMTPLDTKEYPVVGIPSNPGWSTVNIYDEELPAGSTHYEVSIKMYSDVAATQSLPEGTKVFFDSIFVPESGYDLRDGKQPFLDGDQSFGIWEGDAENSSSIYGTKPVDDLSRVVLLDYDLPYYINTIEA
jgi:hypothetical protein